MELQEKYEELENIVSTLKFLIDDLTNKEFINDLEEIHNSYKQELDEIEHGLIEKYDQECKMRLDEYIKSVL